jgi:hypothetical protein
MIQVEEIDQQRTYSPQLHVEEASDQIVYSTAKTSLRLALASIPDLLPPHQKIIPLQNVDIHAVHLQINHQDQRGEAEEINRNNVKSSEDHSLSIQHPAIIRH